MALLVWSLLSAIAFFEPGSSEIASSTKPLLARIAEGLKATDDRTLIVIKRY